MVKTMNKPSNSEQAKQIVVDGYDTVYHQYAQLEGQVKWPRMKWLKKLLRRLDPDSAVLDFGCGSGDPAGVAIAKKHKLTGVDISEKQIRLARRNVPDGTFIHNDAGSVDFPPGSFDAVVSFYTIEHIPREEHAELLDRIYQWLKKDGYLLISLEAGESEGVIGEWLGVPMFFSCYDPETMKKLVGEAGFDLLEIAVEIQLEDEVEIPFLWIFARKVPRDA